MLNVYDLHGAVAHAGDASSINADGGVVVWYRRAHYDTFYPFNPMRFTATAWLYYVAGEYEPTDKALSPITISNNKLVRPVAMNEDIYVTVIRERAGQTETAVYLFRSGQTTRNPSGSETFVRLVGLSRANEQSQQIAIEDSNGVVCYVEGETPTQQYRTDDLTIISGVALYRNTTLSMSLNIDVEGEGQSVTLLASMYRGFCEWDISPFVKHLFTNELAQLQEYTEGDNSLLVAQDKRLGIVVTVVYPFEIEGLGSDRVSLFALNGVAQIGEDSCFYLASESLTKLSWIADNKYEGYPLEETFANGNIRDYTIPMYPSGEYSVPKRTVVRRETSRGKTNTLCTPLNPFYIRWINTFGGVEQMMFSVRQVHKDKVKGVSVAEVDVPYTADVTTNERVYDMTTENTISVGADGIGGSDWEIVKKIPFSPEIEWFNERLGKWIRLSIAKWDGEYNSDNATHSIEIEFTLPRLYTQF